MSLLCRILLAITFPIWLVPFAVCGGVWNISSEVYKALEDWWYSE